LLGLTEVDVVVAAVAGGDERVLEGRGVRALRAHPDLEAIRVARVQMVARAAT
jgi:hypothetical protein